MSPDVPEYETVNKDARLGLPVCAYTKPSTALGLVFWVRESGRCREAFFGREVGVTTENILLEKIVLVELFVFLRVGLPRFFRATLYDLLGLVPFGIVVSADFTRCFYRLFLCVYRRDVFLRRETASGAVDLSTPRLRWPRRGQWVECPVPQLPPRAL